MVCQLVKESWAHTQTGSSVPKNGNLDRRVLNLTVRTLTGLSCTVVEQLDFGVWILNSSKWAITIVVCKVVQEKGILNGGVEGTFWAFTKSYRWIPTKISLDCRSRKVWCVRAITE